MTRIHSRRDSWQLWENYSEVAMDVGNVRQVQILNANLHVHACDNSVL